MTVFHVVRSVKGGSGKTTFALHQLVKLITDNNDQKKKVLYIDADVHASETRTMLLRHSTVKSQVNSSESCYFEFFPDQFSGRTDIPEEQMNSCLNHTLNSFMHPYKGYYSKVSELAIRAKLKQIPQSISKNITADPAQPFDDTGVSLQPVLTDTSKYLGQAYFIFSDPSPSGRRVFGNLYQSFGKSTVGVGVYIAKMKTLFSYISEENYTDVIIDMPPGSDTFSEHLMDCLLGFVNKHKDKCKTTVYYVSTIDNAHIRTATVAAIEHIHAMRLQTAEAVYFVYNLGASNDSKFSNRDGIMAHIYMAFNTTGEIYGTSIHKLMFELMRLSYCQLQNDKQYHDATCAGSILLMSNNLIDIFER